MKMHNVHAEIVFLVCFVLAVQDPRSSFPGQGRMQDFF